MLHRLLNEQMESEVMKDPERACRRDFYNVGKVLFYCSKYCGEALNKILGRCSYPRRGMYEPKTPAWFHPRQSSQ